MQERCYLQFVDQTWLNMPRYLYKVPERMVVGLRGKLQDISPDGNRLYQAKLAGLVVDSPLEQNSTSLARGFIQTSVDYHCTHKPIPKHMREHTHKYIHTHTQTHTYENNSGKSRFHDA